MGREVMFKYTVWRRMEEKGNAGLSIIVAYCWCSTCTVHSLCKVYLQLYRQANVKGGVCDCLLPCDFEMAAALFQKLFFIPIVPTIERTEKKTQSNKSIFTGDAIYLVCGHAVLLYGVYLYALFRKISLPEKVADGFQTTSWRRC